MIEDINAQSREDIYYDTLKGVLLYHNTLNEYPLHWHNEVELILPLSGSFQVKFHNDSSAVVNCVPGDIMLIAPGTLHEYLSVAPATHRFLLWFRSLKLFRPTFMLSRASSLWKLLASRTTSGTLSAFTERAMNSFRYLYILW